VARPVIWSSRARSDLRLPIEFIKKDSPEAARRFATAAIQVSRSLGDLWERGRVVPELADPLLRELILGRYRFVYEILEDRIAIARLIHTSRDFRRTWGRP
jgi:toxin ParE1/3/4